MPYFESDEVVAIVNDEGMFHIECYEGNLHELNVDNIITENHLEDDDWYFCDKCRIIIQR